VIAGALLLLPAAWFTWSVIDGLGQRRELRTELAEISHVRYGLLNADRWRNILVPILNARIDALDLRAQDRASLRPTVEKALYRLLDDVKEKMSATDSQNSGLGGLMGQGNALIANMMMGTLRPHVPEYANVVLEELGKPENKQALKNYIRNVLAEGAGKTFGNVDMKWYAYLLKKHGCADAKSCQDAIGGRILRMDQTIERDYILVLASSAAAFLLLMAGVGVLGRPAVVVLLLFCMVLLAGGVFSPMLEVEAKITRVTMTILGERVTFQDQLLYFQSKSVLEVFRSLITQGRPEMWVVGVLVLTFSVIFPVLKMFSLGFCLHKPDLLRNRMIKFLALDSAKWSMADVMALAIFMSFVAFNGLISNTMQGLHETGAELVIPTDSSKILPGYYLFIGFCLASLTLSKKLERGIRR
jgi:hypothetical protein